MISTIKYFAIIVLFLPLLSFSQKVENIRFEQVGKKIHIYYDLTGTGSYNVKVYCSTDNDKSWGKPLQKVEGDVGGGIKAGKHEVIWNVLSERNELKGKIRFKVVAKPVIKHRSTTHIEALFGFSFVPPATKYSMIKYGGEIGWGYKNAGWLFTSLAANYGFASYITDNFTSSVSIIEPGKFNGLNTNSVKVDGFVEKQVYNCYGKIGYFFPKTFYFALTVNAGFSIMSGYDVFEADKDYQSDNNQILKKGNLFIDDGGRYNKTNFIYGFGVMVMFGKAYYLSFDYFIPNHNDNGIKYALGLGMAAIY